ncbi:response regulator [Thermodesulforhabdus norvegica]|uniref:Response regulator receiver domain-containing protein n=1 Tax=Thermodesulforhabdus norvegica TaxID=39841 RepID=A0A1I4U662_9BACT|nr:response regulator [Thermodesulforhabdus norvegica]SFM84173.1 Response regulator receiver domain-containing protein [Thermodesulforhabdus norvegica]
MSEKARILIVDDEDRFRKTLKKNLQLEGFFVDDASSGSQALEKLSGSSYDVVLLDIRMPGMNGITALEKIKQMSPQVEVIVLTGHASVDVAVKIMQLGGYEYCLKPCDVKDLISKIEHSMEKKVRSNK